MFEKIVEFIRCLYPDKTNIPLHEPVFVGNEKIYLNKCIDSTFVSSVGEYVDLFEKKIKDYLGVKKTIAVVNGTAALHISLILSGVENGDEVLTQSLSFVATSNAINYCGAHPVYIDIDKQNLGLSPKKLLKFLKTNTIVKNGQCINKKTSRRISACLPMHTFGYPAKIDSIVNICNQFNIPVVEDAAESLGSKYKGKYTGTFGKFGVLSFNGNKIITTGGGGMILTNDAELGNLAKHLTSTAKVSNLYEFVHDRVGYNYRMPNINAALGCAQLEKLDVFLKNKQDTAKLYKDFFKTIGIDFLYSDENRESNCWLNAISFKNKSIRDEFIEYSNNCGIMARPVWKLLNRLEMYMEKQTTGLENSELVAERIVNIPSSVRQLELNI